ncbi:MAG: hypothetical protein P4L43_18300 [Syntrophobacteraceae bacterium]|nr:hypothetical protein [Syntrophobacteraceae bacterium]
METCILSEDLLAIMRVVKEHGGTHCSGTCHHRKPGEFHCHTISQMLKMSSSGVKERLRNLVEMGLMERRRGGGGAMSFVTFVVSPEGEKVLAAQESGPSS